GARQPDRAQREHRGATRSVGGHRRATLQRRRPDHRHLGPPEPRLVRARPSRPRLTPRGFWRGGALAAEPGPGHGFLLGWPALTGELRTPCPRAGGAAPAWPFAGRPAPSPCPIGRAASRLGYNYPPVFVWSRAGSGQPTQDAIGESEGRYFSER